MEESLYGAFIADVGLDGDDVRDLAQLAELGVVVAGYSGADLAEELDCFKADAACALLVSFVQTLWLMWQKVPAAPVMRTWTSFRPRSSDISKATVALVHYVGRSVSRVFCLPGKVANYLTAVLRFDFHAFPRQVTGKKTLDW